MKFLSVNLFRNTREASLNLFHVSLTVSTLSLSHCLCYFVTVSALFLTVPTPAQPPRATSATPSHTGLCSLSLFLSVLFLYCLSLLTFSLAQLLPSQPEPPSATPSHRRTNRTAKAHPPPICFSHSKPLPPPISISHELDLIGKIWI